VAVVDLDPDQVTYGGLLDVFWECHDPAGPAHNEDWLLDLERSAIFVADGEQRPAADAALASVISTGCGKTGSGILRRMMPPFAR